MSVRVKRRDKRLQAQIDFGRTFVAVLRDLTRRERAAGSDLGWYRQPGMGHRQQERQGHHVGPPAAPSLRGSATPVNSPDPWSRTTIWTHPM